jgi:hypothetical protein
LGKAHRIHAALNNPQAENQYIVLKMSTTIIDQTFSILIDLGATKISISGVLLKIIKVKAVKHDEFSYVEMASSAKKKVGGRVTNYSLNLGYFLMKANLYVIVLRSYDIVIGMD